MNIFAPDGRIWTLGQKLWHLLVLNCCFLIGCLPLLTVGSSLIALNEGIRLEQKDEYSPRRFWATWHATWVLGLCLELLVGMPFGICAGIVAAISALKSSPLLALPIIGLFALLLLVAPFLFLLPALDQSYRRLPEFSALVGESISLAFTQAFAAILLVVSWLLVIAVSVLLWRLYPLWLLVDFSLIAQLQNEVTTHLLHL